MIKPIWRRECINTWPWVGLRLFLGPRTFQMMFSQMTAKRKMDDVSKKTLWIGFTNNFNWIDENDTAYICSITLRSLVIHLLMVNWELNDSQSTTSDRMTASFPSFSVLLCYYFSTIVCEFTIQLVEMKYLLIFVIRSSLCMTWEKKLENDTQRTTISTWQFSSFIINK